MENFNSYDNLSEYLSNSLLHIIRIYHESEGRIEKSLPRIAVWHHEACRVMTNGDPKGLIYCPILSRIMYSFSCSPLYLFID